MKLNVKKILFGFVCLCAVLVLCLWRMPLTVKTNLNSLIDINNSDWPISELTNKFSNVANIVIEAQDFDSVKQTASAITGALSKDEFNDLSIINTDVSVSNAIKELNAHRNSFLSLEYRDILKRGNYSDITGRAIAAISGSMSPTVLLLKDDPFLLVTNFVGELKNAGGKWGMRDGFLWQYVAPKHYVLMSVNINSQDTSDLARNIKALSNIAQENRHGDSKIFMSGIPVHTADMTQTSKMQLTLFSLVALLAAILLNWLLFRKASALIPVVFSLTLGFLAGSVALFLCFSQPHILTFVFGVTLIGLGIDFSFHFINALIYKNNKNVQKNIFHSFLTTVVCFLPLMFSSVSLLQQISVFTIVGLGAVYLGWLVFMPKEIRAEKTSVVKIPMLSKKHRRLFFGAIIAAILITLPFMKTQNSMSQLYRPSAQLIQAESLMQKLNRVGASKFLLIRGSTLDDALQNSETVKDETKNFFNLSTILPSVNRQTENQNLIRNLYKSESKKIQNELGLKTKPGFTETPFIDVSDIRNNKSFDGLLDKFVFDDGKYIYLIANVDTDFATSNPNAITISPAQQMSDLMRKYSNESYRLLALCGISLIVLLIVLYKKRAFAYLAPSVLAVGLTASMLTWFNQPITFFHLLSLFIVVGLTLDYSIFHINAKNNQEIKPVLFSFLTSVIGFGILGFASFFLIRSMGITLGLGLSFGYLISLVLFRRKK
ncbi:MAG: hypothetical protein K5912_04160 [Alphaproteobacteria bacterium]|nr:hypothetical protein [Alphaproteobacteria bacterium]